MQQRDLTPMLAESMCGPTNPREWPRTLWEPEQPPQGDARCKNCKRSYDFHGTTEVMARRLGFAVNQQTYICRPTGAEPSAALLLHVRRAEAGKGSIEDALDTLDHINALADMTSRERVPDNIMAVGTVRKLAREEDRKE